MIAACLVLLAIAPAADAPDVRAAYTSARDAAGRDPDANVRLSLWCEQHQMPAERLKHLALAVMYDPAHTAARGLLGQVKDRDGHWSRPGDANDAGRAEVLAEYARRRDAIEGNGTADDHWNLAAWCESSGLEPEARAHFAVVTRLDPARDAAWKRLGCEKFEGRWLNPDQIARIKGERKAQEQADRHWSARLDRLKARLKDDRKRPDAEAELAAIRDPRAVPSIWKAFAAAGRPEDLRVAAQLLAQIDGVPASLGLARIAVFAPTDEARRAAAEALAWRDPREYVGVLISLVREPFRYEVTPVNGPGQPGALIVQGPGTNLRRFYAPPAPGQIVQPGDQFAGLDADGQPVFDRIVGVRTDRIFRDRLGQTNARVPFDRLMMVESPEMYFLPEAVAMLPLGAEGQRLAKQASVDREAAVSSLMGLTDTLSGGLDSRFLDVTRGIVAHVPAGQIALEARRAAITAEAQLEADVASLDRANAQGERANARVIPLLREATGQDFGPQPDTWYRWWADSQGYAARTSESTTPVVTQVIQPQVMMPPVQFGLGPVVATRAGHSCFAAGTPVRTRDGLRPIESIRPGDLVLAQDTDSGRLDYRPVIATYHNPPDRTLTIAHDRGEPVVATPIHRFWVAGRGWVMARNLAPGDAIRTVGGLAVVSSVTADAVQPVFNLEVAGGSSFFVGEAGLLVHDNSLVRPVPEPFDAAPALAAANAD